MDLPIAGWHAHIYYDPATTKAAAATLREGIAAGFPDAMLGRWHDVPVGPHTAAMYQVAFPPDFSRPWSPGWRCTAPLSPCCCIRKPARQRADHTRHALWMGPPLPLKAEILPE